MLATVSRALSVIGLVTAPPAAEVVRIEVSAHTILTDIDEARWNASGKVEFSSNVFRACGYRAL